MIPDDIIARVRESVDLLEVVRESVPGIKKAGRNYQARCPFHQERTPSFVVNPALGIFKCFGCSAGGDVFKFVMLSEHLTYPEAIKKLAARVQIEIPEERTTSDSPEEKARQRLYQLMDDAAAFYQKHLWQSQEGERARTYLKERGLSDESLKKFLVGYAPASGQTLYPAAQTKGYSIDELDKAGLVRRRDDKKLYDYFWNRIVFPIWDVQGRLVAFGGRTLGDGIPKYLNSPETAIYSKGRHLYGLFQGLSAIRKKQSLKILEGYVDVIACHQAGYEDAVATLGTALTDDHVRLLRRYVEKVQLIFDPDAAGAQAARRGGELLLAAGFQTTVVHLPNDQDADEVLQSSGPEKLGQALETDIPFINYCVQQAVAKHGAVSPVGKSEISHDLLPMIAKVQDPLLQDSYLGILADALHTEKSVLAQTMRHRQSKTARTTGAPDAAPAPSTKREGILSIEEEMLMIVLKFPQIGWQKPLEAVEWKDPRSQKMWNLMHETAVQTEWPVNQWLEHFSEDDQKWLLDLSMNDRTYRDPEAALAGCIVDWQREVDLKRFHELRREVASMVEGKRPRDEAVIDAYHAIAKRLKGSVSTS